MAVQATHMALAAAVVGVGVVLPVVEVRAVAAALRTRRAGPACGSMPPATMHARLGGQPAVRSAYETCPQSRLPSTVRPLRLCLSSSRRLALMGKGFKECVWRRLRCRRGRNDNGSMQWSRRRERDILNIKMPLQGRYPVGGPAAELRLR